MRQRNTSPLSATNQGFFDLTNRERSLGDEEMIAERFVNLNTTRLKALDFPGLQNGNNGPGARTKSLTTQPPMSKDSDASFLKPLM